MRVSLTRDWTNSVGAEVVDAISSKVTLRPKQIRITEEMDSLDLPAWRLLLILPAPQGETWNREEVFTSRRAAIEAFDAAAERDGRELPGQTIAFVTTDEAQEKDIAEDDLPEPDEDPR